MCPSYRATRDERHSTRGRAKLLAELFQGEVTPATWRNRDVHDALELCLACKGCAVDCPTQVDMASYKAEFNARYYARRLRPRAMYAFALLPTLLRAGSRAPRLANALLRLPVVSRVGLWAAGITRARPVPAIAPEPLRRSARVLDGRRDRPDATVVVWPDTFTGAFRPSMAEDLIAVLERCGEQVAIPSRDACCGRTLYDSGFLDTAKRSLRQLLDVLEPWTSRGIPVVVPEASCLASFRDELPRLLPDDPRAARLASLARSPAEHLLATGALGAAEHRRDRGRVVVHPHCHGRAIGTPAADAELLRRGGYRPEVADAGCCGLAGSFGYRADHEPLSRRIGTEQWLPRLRAQLAGDEPARLVIDGFSCEQQLAGLAGMASETLVGLVREAVEE
jgi:Fe-S oxidoreductase